MDQYSISKSRFYGSAYEKSNKLIYKWHNNLITVKRMPPNIVYRQMIPQPYPQEYINWLSELSKTDKKPALEKIKKEYPFLNFEINENDLIVSIVASGGFWLKKNVKD